MTPNHHYATHIPEQLLDYGPVYGIWCFLNERLNNLIKKYNINNWGHGQLEVALMRALGRDRQTLDIVSLVYKLSQKSTH